MSTNIYILPNETENGKYFFLRNRADYATLLSGNLQTVTAAALSLAERGFYETGT